MKTRPPARKFFQQPALFLVPRGRGVGVEGGTSPHGARSLARDRTSLPHLPELGMQEARHRAGRGRATCLRSHREEVGTRRVGSARSRGSYDQPPEATLGREVRLESRVRRHILLSGGGGNALISSQPQRARLLPVARGGLKFQLGTSCRVYSSEGPGTLCPERWQLVSNV